MDLEASMIQVDLEKKHEEIVWQEIAKYPRIHTGKHQVGWSEDLAEKWKIPVFSYYLLNSRVFFLLYTCKYLA